MRAIDTATQLCAVIGNPVEHSLSPLIHNAAFEAAGLNYVYIAFRVEDVKACLTGMRALPGFRGLSVTIPHKIAVMQYLDDIDPMALNVGSVNTVVHDDAKLRGLTTDGPAVLRAFAEAGISIVGRNVLFIGAGGAVRAVAFAMAQQPKPARITILGRNATRVAALVNDLRAKTQARIDGADLARDLPAAVAAHNIIIQGTPLGMYPNSINETAIPADLLRPEHVVFDMVYRPLRTRLIADAETKGCRTVPGLEMLLNQAALQFEAWTGVPAPQTVMRDALIQALTAP